MMPEEISREHRAARKSHQCFHCYQTIPKGEVHDVFTGKDDTIYTIRSHLDCQYMSHERCGLIGWGNYWDGVPPLLDDIQDGGEFALECSQWRGKFPHVVCRLELGEQLAEIRWQEKLAGRFTEDR